MEIWIPVLVAIVSSLFSYLGSVYKSKNELKKIKEEHKLHIEKLEAEINAQAKLYEENKQTDLAGNMFEKMMDDPKIKQLMMEEVSKNIPKNK